MGEAHRETTVAPRKAFGPVETKTKMSLIRRGGPGEHFSVPVRVRAAHVRGGAL